ncbi:hypothetical protein LVJ82_08610 [Vitreoscilla massiliensis]|uniref:Uncharacterized protein n=1 Tax=Vitreoscilla massiliensis TaxID=1689272 RepID=A0ABY4E6V7_9NEIS|nr:hypothetical protein [Vitreoscilla massiliensis]UOO91009.1 hypothetical protein LVJ82_08610 [Vitreoscilla massiliensis]
MKHPYLRRSAAVLLLASALAVLMPWLLQTVFHLHISHTLTLNLVGVILIALALPYLRPKIALRYWNKRHHPNADKHSPNPDRVQVLPSMAVPAWQTWLRRGLILIAMAAICIGFGVFKLAFMLSTFIWAADNPLIVVFLLAFGCYLCLSVPLIALLKYSAHRHGKTSLAYQLHENWGMSFVDTLGLCLALCLLLRVVVDSLGMV